MKIHTGKFKNWYTGNKYIFCYNFQSIVNLKLEFWGYYDKYMGFHLTLKKYYFQMSPGG